MQSRKMPMAMVFFTVYATWVSSFAFIGSIGSLYSDGPLYMTCFAWNVLFGLLYMVLGRRLWYIGKSKGHLSPGDFFNHVYQSKRLSLVVTIVLSVFTMPYLMIQLYAGAYIIETASGGVIPWRTAAAVFCLIIIIYLWAGGIRALALTDIFYGILIFTTMLASGIFMIKKTGGISRTFGEIAANNPESLVLGTGFEVNSPLAWVCMFLVIPIGALMGPPMWIRFYVVKSEKTFKTMPLLLVIATIMYLGPLLSSAAAKVMLPGHETGDKLIPYLFINNMPIVLSTVILCGIAAASLSTANSQIHGLAALYTVDIHMRYVKKEGSGRYMVGISKKAIIVLSCIAYVLTLKNPGMIIDMGTLGMGGSAQVFIPTAGALFWEKSTGKAALGGLTAGIFLLLTLYFIFDMFIPYAAVVSLLLNASVFIGMSLFAGEEARTYTAIKELKRDFLNRNNSR